MLFIYFSFHYYRFVGCIRNLKYATIDGYKEPEALLSFSEVASGCINACTKSKHTPCANGGKCMNRFLTVKCKCEGTGFKGRNCTIRKYSVGFPLHPEFNSLFLQLD